MFGPYFHDPDAVETVPSIDWTSWLGTDTITTSTWSSTPTGLTITNTGTSGLKAYCRISGGSDGTDYILTNRIVTSAGETFDRSILISCRTL